MDDKDSLSEDKSILESYDDEEESISSNMEESEEEDYAQPEMRVQKNVITKFTTFKKIKQKSERHLTVNQIEAKFIPRKSATQANIPDQFSDSQSVMSSNRDIKKKKAMSIATLVEQLRVKRKEAEEQEEEDLMPEKIDGIFYLNQTNIFVRCCCKNRQEEPQQEKIRVYDYRSLYCLHFKNRVRIELVNFTSSPLFENTIVFLIFINSLVLFVYDYNDRQNKLEWNQRLEFISRVCTIFFTVEMILKVLSQGFILHFNAYMRDKWNWLDFMVVITGIMEIMELSWLQVKSLRTLRVLRPLRSIKAFPKMRNLVSSLANSASMLFNAVIFMIFIFMIFGILGIQQFQGSLYNRCRFTEEPLGDGTWLIDEELDFVCSQGEMGLMKCPADRFCKQPADAGLSSEIDTPFDKELTFYNMLGFDNLGWAMLTIFQMITLEQWTTVMYMLMDSNNVWMAVIFSVSLVLIGSFFLLNVILAVLAEALKSQNRQKSTSIKKISQSLDRAEARRKSIQGNWFLPDNQDDGSKDNKSLTELGQQQASENSQNNLKIYKKSLTEEGNDYGNLKRMGSSVSSRRNFDKISKSNEDQSDLLLIPNKQPTLRRQATMLKRNVNTDMSNVRRGSLQVSLRSPLQFKGVQKDVIAERQSLGDFQDQNGNKKQVEQQDLNLSDDSQSTQQTDIPERASSKCIYKVCYLICTHWSFTALITVLIIANTVVLAMDQYPEDAEVTEISNRLNEVFTWCFIVEMLIKLIGLGFREYARDSFNLFDALIVVLSVVDMIITATIKIESPTHSLSAFRGVRLLRVFKLARSWKSFRQILQSILVTLKELTTFSILLLIFMFTFSLLGMELFGFQLQFYNDQHVNKGDQGYEQSEAPRPNFNSVPMGLTSIFAVTIGDDWNYFMAMAFRAQGFIAFVFYPIVFIGMNLVLLNLFLAILLQKFEEGEVREPPKKKHSSKDSFSDQMTRKCLQMRKKCGRIFACCISSADSRPQANAPSQLRQECNQELAHPINSHQQYESNRSNRSKAESSSSERGLHPVIVEQSEISSSSNRQHQQEIKDNMSTPGNQQDFDIFEDDKGDRKQECQNNNEEAALSQKDQEDGQNKANIVEQIQKIIPSEYQPKNFESLTMKDSQNLSSEEKKRFQELQSTAIMLANSNTLMSLAQLKQIEQLGQKRGDKRNIKLVGRSLCLFSKESRLRKFCLKIVQNSFYNPIVLILIALSTFCLTLDNPNNDKNGQLTIVLNYMDIILTTCFTIECLINIILFGLLFNGETSYMRDAWNFMDMSIVIISILTVGGLSEDLRIFKTFRILRVLLPLRILKRNFGIKIQVASLMNAIPGVSNLLLISSLMMMIFGIQAVVLLKGHFFYCETTNVPEDMVPKIVTKWDCLDYGADWVNQDSNFDNLLNAVITMFGMMSTEGWLEVMWNAVDSTVIHQVPRRNNKMPLIIFFSIFMIIASIFILNLFVGIVINTFNTEKEKLSRNALMTSLQNEYCEVLLKCYQLKPLAPVITSTNKFQDKIQRFVNSNAFTIFIFACICGNTIVLALPWYGMDRQIFEVLETMNFIFVIIYTVEMVLKLIAFDKNYFKDNWCVFDFIIVVSAWIGIFLFQFFNIDIGVFSTIIRSFRIARVIKLIKSAKKLHQIVQTFILALPELLNVGALLMLFLLLFTVLGVHLFAEVKIQESLNQHANFQNFFSALLTLFRIVTGEGWVTIMENSARSPSILFSCIENQSFESKERDGILGCGNPAAYIYFIAFVLIVSIVFLNLFIAIILEGFSASAQEHNIRVKNHCFEVFQKAWQKYDPQATEMIAVSQLENLIMDLISEELQILQKNKNDLKSVNFNLYKNMRLRRYLKTKTGWNALQKRLQKNLFIYIRELQIPLYGGMEKIQFHDTLNAIIWTVYKRLHKETVEEISKRIETKIRVGEKLYEDDSIQVGSEKFWKLKPIDQERILEQREPDFQRVVNRLENKGHFEGQEILKLKLMRNMRQKVGARFSSELFIMEDVVLNERYVYDSSHYSAGQVILKFLMKRRAKNKSVVNQQSSLLNPTIPGYPTATVEDQTALSAIGEQNGEDCSPFANFGNDLERKKKKSDSYLDSDKGICWQNQKESSKFPKINSLRASQQQKQFKMSIEDIEVDERDLEDKIESVDELEAKLEGAINEPLVPSSSHTSVKNKQKKNDGSETSWSKPVPSQSASAGRASSEKPKSATNSQIVIPNQIDFDKAEFFLQNETHEIKLPPNTSYSAGRSLPKKSHLDKSILKVDGVISEEDEYRTGSIMPSQVENKRPLTQQEDKTLAYDDQNLNHHHHTMENRAVPIKSRFKKIDKTSLKRQTSHEMLQKDPHSIETQPIKFFYEQEEHADKEYLLNEIDQKDCNERKKSTNKAKIRDQNKQRRILFSHNQNSGSSESSASQRIQIEDDKDDDKDDFNNYECFLEPKMQSSETYDDSNANAKKKKVTLKYQGYSETNGLVVDKADDSQISQPISSKRRQKSSQYRKTSTKTHRQKAIDRPQSKARKISIKLRQSPVKDNQDEPPQSSNKKTKTTKLSPKNQVKQFDAQKPSVKLNKTQPKTQCKNLLASEPNVEEIVACNQQFRREAQRSLGLNTPLQQSGIKKYMQQRNTFTDEKTTSAVQLRQKKNLQSIKSGRSVSMREGVIDIEKVAQRLRTGSIDSLKRYNNRNKSCDNSPRLDQVLKSSLEANFIFDQAEPNLEATELSKIEPMGHTLSNKPSKTLGLHRLNQQNLLIERLQTKLEKKRKQSKIGTSHKSALRTYGGSATKRSHTN